MFTNENKTNSYIYKKLFTQISHYVYIIYLINDFLFIFILTIIIYISINVCNLINQ